MLGLIRYGAIPIPCTTLLTPKDIAFRVQTAEAHAIITDADGAAKVERFDGILVRADPEQSDSIVATTEARPMEMRGRQMQGWLRVDADDVVTKEKLARWVELGTTYARSRTLLTCARRTRAVLVQRRIPITITM